MKASNRYGAAMVVLVAGVAGLNLTHHAHAAIDLRTPSWSVAYLIDNSETVLGLNQSVDPRDNRGLALSPDGKFLYAGYNNSVGSGGEVRRIDLDALAKDSSGAYLANNNYTTATLTRLVGPRGKAIATDDLGRVYVAASSQITVYSADLSTVLGSIPVAEADGVSVVRNGSSLLAYTSKRGNVSTTTAGLVQSWSLTETGPNITGASLNTTFNGTGQITFTGPSAYGNGLRGVEVDPVTGNVWVASVGDTTIDPEPLGGQVFTYLPDGSSLFSPITLDQAFDIGFDGDQVLITQRKSPRISIFDRLTGSFTSLFTISAIAAGLELDPDGQSVSGAFAGIAVIPGVGVYVANEGGQTADEKSIYGPTPDLLRDDNDPILFAHAPEPGTLMLLALSLPLIARRPKRS